MDENQRRFSQLDPNASTLDSGIPLLSADAGGHGARGVDVGFVQVVEFENSAPKTLGAKEEAIRKQLGLSPIRYYQLLNIAIDMPEIIEKFPVLTARLRRIRDSREQQRVSRRSSSSSFSQ